MLTLAKKFTPDSSVGSEKTTPTFARPIKDKLGAVGNIIPVEKFLAKFCPTALVRKSLAQTHKALQNRYQRYIYHPVVYRKEA